MSIFIDTSAFIARYFERDQYHEEALVLWNRLEEDHCRLVTTNFVLDETITLLSLWGSPLYSSEFADAVYASEILTILRPTECEEKEAIKLLKKYADHKMSFTDCISFAVMREESLTQAFTFDRDFQIAGFEILSSSGEFSTHLGTKNKEK